MVTMSIRDVARLAGVSVGTVSNVLNRSDRVSAETAARVRSAIDELGFVPNSAARQLRVGHSSTLGFVMLDMGNPFFAEVGRGANDAAALAGLSVLLGASDQNSSREGDYLDLFEEQRVRGVLISPIGDVTPHLRRIRERGIGSVLVDRNGTGTGFSSVSVDDVAGGYAAARHLLDQGRRRIAYLGAQFEIQQVTDRLKGARRAIADVGGATFEVISARGLTVSDGRDVGKSLGKRAVRSWPDAIFASNDLLAIGLVQALILTGTARVPDDIAIVGYDDNEFASAAIIPLTTVRQPSRLLGTTAVQILLEEAADSKLEPRNVQFQPQLVVRQTSMVESGAS
ncbi:MAG: LacI family transcriptional regulator [Microbacterium sp.]|nr:LacI family transcriptional regulator [Microbacterium sp.]MBA4346480.1 LacI family transcriptional regulator [Microbacterium sp.]